MIDLKCKHITVSSLWACSTCPVEMCAEKRRDGVCVGALLASCMVPSFVLVRIVQ